MLKTFFGGDTDSDRAAGGRDDLAQPPFAVLKRAFSKGIDLPWNLAVSMPVDLWLMFTRVMLGHDGGLTDWDHLIGAMVITIAGISVGEVAREVRFLIIPLVVPLFVTPFVYGAGVLSILAGVVAVTVLICSVHPSRPGTRPLLRLGSLDRLSFPLISDETPPRRSGASTPCTRSNRCPGGSGSAGEHRARLNQHALAIAEDCGGGNAADPAPAPGVGGGIGGGTGSR
ncbi:hypothetical protein [Thioalkalivibrio sp.]|uniref:hypothetical protein n=1 Tax=Thioalkalivibrio sp. TaxID=2093813 RepID=UPI0025FE0DB4|nr:hypothetical protein [Thioalkalivibrio sp.]